MKKQLINFLKFLLFLGLGLGILYLVYQKQNTAFIEDCALKNINAETCGTLLQKVFKDFREANYFWIFMVLLAFTVSNVSRAIKWQMLLRPLGYRPRFINAFLTTILGYFANLGLPRMGEVVRGATLARYENIPVEKVMGTIVVDRIIDVISILLVTSLAFVLEYEAIWQFVEKEVSLSERFGSSRNLLLVLAGIGVFILLLFYLFRKPLMRTRLMQKVIHLAQGFLQGIQTVRNLQNPGLFLFHSFNIWLMYYTMTYFCFFTFEPTSHLSPLAALVVFVFGGWGVVIPSPGGMGTYHFLAQTALSIYGVSGDDGFSWANISFFSIQLGCNISIGLLAIFILPMINRAYQPQPKVA
ncbi:MAG TPA: lysylphosphatidylglycerol synthase transmembrane domain-containing protein [Saprospiraceae bacterium]|nr:lysylphosphatidylglycerol synthase transmembrane domain-containing protein [Saprospiraceae bacterium]HMQ81629.1 lysylphosphatidylglycerol synthase transmembrane domain-containing protein [Saprospiraceae bacterium]